MAEVRISGTRELEDVEMAGDVEEDVEVVETEDAAGAEEEAQEEIQEAPVPQLSFIEYAIELRAYTQQAYS